MSEVIDAPLRLAMEEQLRLARGSLALRPLTAVCTAAMVVLHAPMNPSRYMFLAALLPLVGWVTDAAVARRAEALAQIAETLRLGGVRRAEAVRLNVGAFESALGWRRALFAGARVRWFLPMLLAGAAVAVDAQRFGADDTPGELVWYLALLFVALCVTAAAAWSWWLDRFGEVAPTVRVLEVPANVVPLAAPPSVVVPTPRPEEPGVARWIPKHDPNERPFPDAPRPSAPPPPPRSGTTQTFATVESPEVSPDTPDAP
jgi:hypothetical protein